jgi:E3 ubiquitin-protein ligase synoviolin
MLFYGIPIHIMRDLFMTTRSFVKRLTAFIKYRRATQDMNNRYEDATAEELQREDTCIICREEMRPWSVTNPQAPAAAPGAAPGAPQAARPAGSVNERSRPKKLPCGHILHLGCLKSWLERQQICPTCRANVGQPQPPRSGANNANLPGAPGPQPPIEGQQDGPAPPPAAGRAGRARGMRMLNFGPLRVGFGQANLQDMAQGFGGQPGQDNAVAGGARVYGLELGFPRRQQPQPQDQGPTNTAESNSLQNQLQQIEQQIVSEIRNLQVSQQELQLVQLLQVELARLRLMQNGATDALAANFQMPQMPQLGPLGVRQTARFTTPLDQMQRHGARSSTSAIPAGSADLPPGVTIPEGWSLLPLERLDGSVTQAGTVPASNAGVAPTATTQQVSSPMPGTSNNTPTPNLTANPENHSQASSVDSSDTNAIHTPPSVIADQPTSQSSTSDTTLRGNMPIASTPATLATSDPSLLPGWGSSQLFSESSLTGNTNSGVTNPAPPPISGDGGSSMGVGQSSSSAQDSEERKDKGKAKAVTVEDTIDESEGA